MGAVVKKKLEVMEAIATLQSSHDHEQLEAKLGLGRPGFTRYPINNRKATIMADFNKRVNQEAAGIENLGDVH